MKKMDLLFQQCKKTGLSKKDIDYILKENIVLNEKPSFSGDPNPYYGGWYGTTSILDFKFIS